MSKSPTMNRLHINGRLYVDDMAPGTGDADLRRHFGRYGDVANIFIPTCRLTGEPRCCAFVQFSSPRDAGHALEDPCHVINGQEVYIARARPRRHLKESSVVQPNTSMPPAMSKLHPNGRLYIDDMAPGTGEVDLRSYFGRYGDVANIFIPTYRLTGQPRCCAFVQFSSPGDAGRALADRPHVINGQAVYIGRAQTGHLEKSSVYQYKPLSERQMRDGPWRGYRVGNIGKTSWVSNQTPALSKSPPMNRLHINGRLYVDDMAPGTGDADLRRHFGRYGDVANIFIPTCRLTGEPRCCAFVQFSRPRGAGNALEDPCHVIINGQEVYIARARPRRHLKESSVVQPNSSMPPAMSKLHPNGRLYIDDMAPGTGEVDLRSYFGRYGDVADIFIPMYRLTGEPRCCAFVQFSSPGDAGRALADPRHVINGREVYIARAQKRHLEESSVYQYKPLCERQKRDGPWRGYRVGDIGKASLGPLVYDSKIIYISEDGVQCWCIQVTMHTESKSTGYGPRQQL